jgi:hypothetical protein
MGPTGDGLGYPVEQARANASTLVGVGDMEVVEQSPPRWVLIEDGVREADQAALVLGKNRERSRISSFQSVGPHREPIDGDVTVEEGVGIDITIVTAPAIGM